MGVCGLASAAPSAGAMLTTLGPESANGTAGTLSPISSRATRATIRLRGVRCWCRRFIYASLDQRSLFEIRDWRVEIARGVLTSHLQSLISNLQPHLALAVLEQF